MLSPEIQVMLGGAVLAILSLSYGIYKLVKRLRRPKVFNLEMVDFTKSNKHLDKIEDRMKADIDKRMRDLRTFYTITQCANQSLEDIRLDDLFGTCEVIQELCRFNDINGLPCTMGLVNTRDKYQGEDLRGYFEV